jgi:hypothetical protein
MKRLYEVFEDSDHAAMLEKKQKLAEENGRKSIGWRDYFLHVTGVRKIGQH